MRYQADNTYRGKRNNSCWNVAESTLRILMSKFYGGPEKVPKLNGRSIDSLKRKELCQILEQTAFEKIENIKNKVKFDIIFFLKHIFIIFFYMFVCLCFCVF